MADAEIGAFRNSPQVAQRREASGFDRVKKAGHRL